MVGLNLFSPVHFKTRKFTVLQRAQWSSAYLVCKSGRGEGLVATLSTQHCMSDELFSGLCLPGCLSLWVTPPLAMRVTVRYWWQLFQRELG